MQKAIADLQTVGIAEADIELVNVRAETSTGIFSRSSSATYWLSARCRKLDGLADVLTTVTDQKNVSLNSLSWGYPDETESALLKVEECYQKAGLKAERMAKALGVRLGGVHSAQDSIRDAELVPQGPGAVKLEFSTYRARPVGESGVELRHRKTVTHIVQVAYLVDNSR